MYGYALNTQMKLCTRNHLADQVSTAKQVAYSQAIWLPLIQLFASVPRHSTPHAHDLQALRVPLVGSLAGRAALAAGRALPALATALSPLGRALQEVS